MGRYLPDPCKLTFEQICPTMSCTRSLASDRWKFLVLFFICIAVYKGFGSMHIFLTMPVHTAVVLYFFCYSNPRRSAPVPDDTLLLEKTPAYFHTLGVPQAISAVWIALIPQKIHTNICFLCFNLIILQMGAIVILILCNPVERVLSNALVNPEKDGSEFITREVLNVSGQVNPQALSVVPSEWELPMKNTITYYKRQKRPVCHHDTRVAWPLWGELHASICRRGEHEAQALGGTGKSSGIESKLKATIESFQLASSPQDFLGLPHKVTKESFYYNSTKGFYCLKEGPGLGYAKKHRCMIGKGEWVRRVQECVTKKQLAHKYRCREEGKNVLLQTRAGGETEDLLPTILPRNLQDGWKWLGVELNRNKQYLPYSYKCC